MTRANPNHTFDSSNTRANIARFLAALAEPKLFSDLRAELHMTERTMGFYVQHLKLTRRIRTCEWRLINSRWKPVLALGDAPDCAKPEAQSEQLRNALRRKKVRKDPELLLRQEQREKVRWITQKAAALPKQGPFAALGL